MCQSASLDGDSGEQDGPLRLGPTCLGRCAVLWALPACPPGAIGGADSVLCGVVRQSPFPGWRPPPPHGLAQGPACRSAASSEKCRLACGVSEVPPTPRPPV